MFYRGEIRLQIPTAALESERDERVCRGRGTISSELGRDASDKVDWAGRSSASELRLAFEHGELMAEGQVLEREIAAWLQS